MSYLIVLLKPPASFYLLALQIPIIFKSVLRFEPFSYFTSNKVSLPEESFGALWS